MRTSARVWPWPALWAGGYLLFAALLLWMNLRMPSSPLGEPADPTSRMGIFSVLVLPLAVWLGTVLARMDEDATAVRVATVVVLAVAAAVAATVISLLPDDLASCLALRRLPQLPDRCATTPGLRLTVLAEATGVWLLFGAAWAVGRWRRARRRR